MGKEENGIMDIVARVAWMGSVRRVRRGVVGEVGDGGNVQSCKRRRRER